MKQIYEKDGYKGYKLKIAGYECQLFETPDGHYSISVPMGDTPSDKKMFDNLVYNHQRVYHARSKDEAIAQVEDFIINYKK
jgi:hypothetical protein